MENYLLQNFLDPIAKVWSAPRPSYSVSQKRQKERRFRKSKEKRLPK